MARGVRARITWLATSVTLGVSVLVCVGVYAGLHVGLYREVDGFLDGEVQEFHAILTNEWNDDLGEIEREIRAEIGSRSNTDLVFRLLDSDGKLLITSDPDDRFANPWRVPTELRAVGAGAWRESIDPPLSAAPYRLCARIERLPNRGDMIIQAAYRVDHVRRSLALCRVFCLGAVAVAAGLAFMGGRAVARSSMAPVVSIMNAARQIGAERLSARVPRLARAMSSMPWRKR